MERHGNAAPNFLWSNGWYTRTQWPPVTAQSHARPAQLTGGTMRRWLLDASHAKIANSRCTSGQRYNGYPFRKCQKFLLIFCFNFSLPSAFGFVLFHLTFSPFYALFLSSFFSTRNTSSEVSLWACFAAAENMQNIFEVQSTENIAASSCETTPAVAMVAARGSMVGALGNATRKKEQHQTGEALPIFCVLDHYWFCVYVFFADIIQVSVEASSISLHLLNAEFIIESTKGRSG